MSTAILGNKKIYPGPVPEPLQLQTALGGYKSEVKRSLWVDEDFTSALTQDVPPQIKQE